MMGHLTCQGDHRTPAYPYKKLLSGIVEGCMLGQQSYLIVEIIHR